MRCVSSKVPSRGSAAELYTGASVRPDDRPQARGPGVAPQDVPTRITIQPGGFDWADAAVGAAVALGGVMLVSGLSLVARRHRRTSVATR